MPTHRCACPACGRHLTVPNELLGRAVKCANCSEVFTATTDRSEETVIPDVYVLDEDDRPARRAKPDRSQRDYEPTRGKAVVTMALLGVAGFVDFISLFVDGWLYRLWMRLADGEAVPERTLETAEGMAGLVGIATLVVMIATAVAFLLWFYRVHRNLRGLGAAGLEYSSGWAVGGFFVPILNLFRPYQIAREVWKGSDPNADPADPTAWRLAPVSPLLLGWWLAWLGTNIAGNAAFRVSLRAETFTQQAYAELAAMISSALSVIAALLAILMVQAIEARQEARHRRLMEEADDAADQPAA
jgi:hypothetical protein